MLSACYVLIIDLDSRKRLTSSKEDHQESCPCRAYILMWETGNKQSENNFGEKIKECDRFNFPNTGEYIYLNPTCSSYNIILTLLHQETRATSPLLP